MINELNQLKNSGVYCNGTLYLFIVIFICDAPARAFISGTKSHSPEDHNYHSILEELRNVDGTRFPLRCCPDSKFNSSG